VDTWPRILGVTSGTGFRLCSEPLLCLRASGHSPSRKAIMNSSPEALGPAVACGISRSVPNEFRELAEKDLSPSPSEMGAYGAN
jgi:hypothetical protein